MKTIRELVALGYTSERIVQYFADQEEVEADKARVEAGRIASAEKTAKYYANKEAHGATCKTCGCLISINSVSGYCRKHVAKDTLSKETKAPKIKYVTKTFYGVKGNDLMDHQYYQGGSVSPR